MLNTQYKFGAIVLAAGLSSRLDGECKHTKLWNGRPLLQYCIDALRLLPLKQVVVVLGYNKKEVVETVNLEAFKIVSTPAPEEGLSQSIRTGVKAVTDNLDGLFICLGDMPGVEPDIFTALAKNFNPDNDKDICVPTHQDRTGNPALFGKRWFQSLTTLTGDRGAKKLIQENTQHLNKVEVSSPGIFMDFDRQEDFLR
ncbi:MAG: nucleotidyltransferase family protein [Methyloligellaceae bacterium]